jgi:cytochrome c556
MRVMASRNSTAAIVAGLTILAIAATGTLGQAQMDKRAAEGAVRYRQSTMNVLYNNFGPLGAMASGKAPFDAKKAQTLATRAVFMSNIAAEVFPAGSGPESGVTTKAKAQIWTDQAEFQKLMKDAHDKLEALAKATRSGKLETMKAAFGPAGAACKACHDKFKEE